MSSKSNKVLKIVGIVVGAFVALVFILTYTVSADVEMERSVVINRSSDEVFDYVKYLRNQYNFSVWGSIDPDMHQEFRGTDGTVGFVAAWDGNEEAGAGEQEITGMVYGERIDYELRFTRPFQSTSQAFMTTEAIADDQTQVTWGFSATFPRPLNLLLLFVDLEDALGSDYETGLANLKAILEAEDAEPIEE